jgi:hypothetical protein
VSSSCLRGLLHDQLITGSTYTYFSVETALMKADLHFQSATGFGKWRLLCSDSFLSALARDREQSRLALKKLRYVLVACLRNEVPNPMGRELSFGYFSETNQLRLTRDSPVDIFRARLPGDLRLVVSHFLDPNLNIC